MPEIRFDNFDAGLDVRRSADTSGANQFRVLTNAYISTGKQIKKRPGLLRITTVLPQQKGLKAVNGKLLTFSAFNTGQNGNPLLLNVVASLTSQANVEISKVHYADSFGGLVYASIEYVNGVVKHHYFDGGSSEITDANCPHSRSVVKIASKFFAIAGSIVRFSATGLPRNWTAPLDAGFLATGFQQQGATTATWVGEFQQNQLVVAFPDAIQLWTIDPNPANITLSQRLFNIGSLYAKSSSQVGGDLFFLSDKGFRSIFVSSQTDNLRDSDIGSPIDILVRANLFVPDPIAVYYADLGQYWCIFDTTAFVYSYSRTAKLSAWCKYVFPFVITDVTSLGGEVYIRAGNNIYQVQQGNFADDGVLINVEAVFSYLDFKAPGALKQVHGIDLIMTGTGNLSFRWDPRNESRVTEEFPITGNTSPGSLQPVELTMTHIGPRLTNSTFLDFSIDSMVFYYDVLGQV